MKLEGRYSPGLYAGVTGILALVLVNAFTIPSSLKQAQERDSYRNQTELEKARLSAQSELEQERAKLTKRTADTYAENEVKPVSTFSIWGYVDNPSQPPMIDFRAFPDPTQQVFIYDSANKCVGVVQNNQFFWRHALKHENICNQGQN